MNVAPVGLWAQRWSFASQVRAAWRGAKRHPLRVAVSGLYLGMLAYEVLWSYATPPSYRFHLWLPLMVAGVLGTAVTIAWRGREIPRVAWILPMVAVALALLSYPNTSRDFVRYLFDGEMIRVWHLSPYAHLPGELPWDQYSSIFRDAFWVTIPSPYGPLWQALMVAINWIDGNRLVLGIVALKLVNLTGLVTCAWLMFRISGKSWVSFVFLLNPVVLLDTVATPHLDIVIAAAVLGAYHLRNIPMRGFLLAIAGLLKAHGIIFAPFLSRRPRELGWLMLSMAAGLAGLLVVLKPILGFDWLTMLRANSAGGVNANESLLFYTLLPHASIETVYLLSYILFALGYGIIWVLYLRRRITSLTALILVSFLVPLCLTGLVLPWHFIIPLTLLLLSDSVIAYWVVLFLTLLLLRSAVEVFELMWMGAIFTYAGWILFQVHNKFSRPSRTAKRLMRVLGNQAS